jgi:DNA-binding NtrC family response regulator
LNVFNIILPPLRERKDDIPLLLNHFIHLYNLQTGKNIKGASAESQQLFLDYNWPGNVRELKNYVEQAVLLEKSEYITPGSLPPILTKSEGKLLTDAGPEVDFRRQVMSYEKNLILSALRACKGKKKEAAKRLGLSPRLLSYYLAKYLINRSDIEDPPSKR